MIQSSVTDAPTGTATNNSILPEVSVSRPPRPGYEERLWTRLMKYRVLPDDPNACYGWSGATSSDYGILADRRRGSGKCSYAHRVAYELEVGPIPQEMYVLHSCDHKWCTNVSHLHVGTIADNNQEIVDRSRRRIVAGEKHWAQEHPEWVRAGNDHWMRLHPELIPVHRQGASNGNARFADEDILRMRREWDGTWKSTRWLAGLYNTKPSVVNKILQRKTRTDLPDEPGMVLPGANRNFARGESVSSAVLTAEIVLDIWNKWQAFPNKHRAQGAFCRAIAERYGVGQNAIEKILRGTTWRHVTRAPI